MKCYSLLFFMVIFASTGKCSFCFPEASSSDSVGQRVQNGQTVQQGQNIQFGQNGQHGQNVQQGQNIQFGQNVQNGQTVQQGQNIQFGQNVQHVSRLGQYLLSDISRHQHNAVVSPLNLYTCLGILQLGARGNTKEELNRLLGPSTQLPRLPADVWSSSAVFLSNSLSAQPKFRQESQAKFQASVVPTNFRNGEASRNQINTWVAEHTNHSITNLLQSPLDSSTKAVAVSALYFHGSWLYPFDPAVTRKGTFTMSKTEAVELPMMSLQANLDLYRGPSYDAISLPYTVPLSFIIILPHQEGPAALQQALPLLGQEELDGIIAKSVSKDVVVVLPRLNIEGNFELRKALQKRGLNAMFDPTRADFGNLVNTTGMYTSQVFHSVRLEVNEAGTRAAAASAGVITKSSRFIFRAVRPFLFAIREKSGLVLFAGIVDKLSSG